MVLSLRDEGREGSELRLAELAARVAAADFARDEVGAERLQERFASLEVEALAWKLLSHFLLVAQAERESADASTVAARFAETLTNYPTFGSERDRSKRCGRGDSGRPAIEERLRC
ncbi:MAG: hypothetical protein NVS3B21_30280 [Acidimicrobiales bacterium]